VDVLIAVLAVVAAFALFQTAWRLAAARRARAVRGAALPEDSIFDPVREGGPALIFFHSPRCAACRRMEPALQRVAAAGRPLLEVDVAAHPQPARALGVLLMPTTLVVRDGRVSQTLIGARSEAALSKALAAAE
jgi:thiol-disulfide isomerase/thioredoxin